MDLNTALNRHFESKIKIRGTDKVDALEAWQSVVKRILDEVKGSDARFSVREMHHTGSFYERAKTEQPNEFDLMLELANINAETYKRVVVDGFTFVTITDSKSKVEWSRDGIVDDQGRLDAVQMRAVFSRLVSDAIRKIKEPGKTITKTTHGPAVTLHISIGNSCELDVDLTLAIKLPSWPSVANSWKIRPRKGSSSQELLSVIDAGGCHVVAKQPPGYSGADRPLMWRFSFSLAEKTIMTKTDGGLANSCRRKVLQILKSIISNDPQLKNVPLRSYHMKTLIFWESEKFPEARDWDASKIGERFLSAVNRMLTYLKKERFPHYFLNNFDHFKFFSKQHCAIITKKFNEIKEDPAKYISAL